MTEREREREREHPICLEPTSIIHRCESQGAEKHEWKPPLDTGPRLSAYISASSFIYFSLDLDSGL